MPCSSLYCVPKLLPATELAALTEERGPTLWDSPQGDSEGVRRVHRIMGHLCCHDRTLPEAGRSKRQESGLETGFSLSVFFFFGGRISWILGWSQFYL